MTLLVVYTTKPGMRKRFLEEIKKKKIDEKVREEEGCLRYEYYCALDREDEILLVEEWVSEEHQKRHTEQPHMADLRELKEQYVVHTEIK